MELYHSFPYKELVDSTTSISLFDKLKIEKKIEFKKVQDQNGGRN